MSKRDWLWIAADAVRWAIMLEALAMLTAVLWIGFVL